MHVQPKEPRFKIEDTFKGFQATIPAGRNWYVILFVSAWMVGWVFGELSAIQELISPKKGSPELFLLAWLTGWTLGGAFALASIAWQVAGKEILLVGSSTLQHRIEAFGVGFTRTYHLSDIKDLRAVELTRSPFGNQAAWYSPFGKSVGTVAFDYGARTYRIAPSLDEAEAKLLVLKLGGRLAGRSHDA